MPVSGKYWLLKAEPDSRVVKGKDVKFSVDDFESVKTSPWEGVRNYEARNLMKEMKVDEQALFYHSNCKNPGVAGFAKVSKEAYPDYTAWDPSHPYFDAKTKQDDPKWFMVDLTFDKRAEHFVSLALLRYITGSSELPSEVEYIGQEGFQAIKTMDLVRKGRLSIQRVDPVAWEAITKMASKGGWEQLDLKKKSAAAGSKKSTSKASPAAGKAPPKRKASAKAKKEEIREESPLTELSDDKSEGGDKDSEKVPGKKVTGGRRKRKVEEKEEEGEATAPRRSKRKM